MTFKRVGSYTDAPECALDAASVTPDTLPLADMLWSWGPPQLRIPDDERPM
jgi:hypothetical protein